MADELAFVETTEIREKFPEFFTENFYGDRIRHPDKVESEGRI